MSIEPNMQRLTLKDDPETIASMTRAYEKLARIREEHRREQERAMYRVLDRRQD